uniref:(northern house mosquito) hypothetical protein n=1 Tax=Culex pipiens TaxID=7175 RepID=A0A8D8G375_CULPI
MERSGKGAVERIQQRVQLLPPEFNPSTEVDERVQIYRRWTTVGHLPVEQNQVVDGAGAGIVAVHDVVDPAVAVVEGCEGFEVFRGHLLARLLPEVVLQGEEPVPLGTGEDRCGKFAISRRQWRRLLR